MGFYYHYDSSKIFIPRESLPAVYEALKARDVEIVANGYSSEIAVRGDGDTLDAVASYNGQYLGRDTAGNVTSFWFDETKGGDNCDWLESIAPFVRKNSFIQCHDDDANVYRYLFTGEVMKRIAPMWEGEEEEDQ